MRGVLSSKIRDSKALVSKSGFVSGVRTMGNYEKKTVAREDLEKNRRLQLSRSFSEKVQKYFIPTWRDFVLFDNPTVWSLILLRAPDLETYKTLPKGIFLVIQTYSINKVCLRPVGQEGLHGATTFLRVKGLIIYSGSFNHILRLGHL